MSTHKNLISCPSKKQETKVIVLKGLPGCGKTFYALGILKREKYKYLRVSKDEIRQMINGEKWANKNENVVLEIRDTIIIAAINEGFNVIVDDTNLNPHHIERIKKLVKGKAFIEIVDLTSVPLEECIERDKSRKDSVGEKVIRDMYERYIKTG